MHALDMPLLLPRHQHEGNCTLSTYLTLLVLPQGSYTALQEAISSRERELDVTTHRLAACRRDTEKATAAAEAAQACTPINLCGGRALAARLVPTCNTAGDGSKGCSMSILTVWFWRPAAGCRLGQALEPCCSRPVPLLCCSRNPAADLRQQSVAPKQVGWHRAQQGVCARNAARKTLASSFVPYGTLAVPWAG